LILEGHEWFRKEKSMALQPLRIPTGWKVNWNIFDEAEPAHFVEEDTPFCWNFTEDLLQLHKDNITVDLGWYPEGKVEGNYLLVLIEKENWAKPVFSFESRDKAVIVHEIEKLLISGT
jgi:hypothetical protein